MELVNLEREIWDMVSLNRTILIYEAKNIGNPRSSGVIDTSSLTGMQLDFYNVLQDSGYSVSASDNKWKITWTDLDAGVQPLQGPKGERGDNGEGFVAWQTVTQSMTAAAFDRLLVNTTSGEVQIVLPANPTVGTQLEFIDIKDNFATYNLVLDGNTKRIMSSTDDYVFDEPAWVRVVYLGGTIGWGLTWLHPGEAGGSSGGESSGESPFTIKVSSYTAIDGDRIDANTTNVGFNITLPESPTLGMKVVVADYIGTWPENNLTILAGDGVVIDGDEDPLVCDIPSRITFMYTSDGWVTKEVVELFPLLGA